MHYTMIKESVHQKDIINLNVYAPNTRVSICMKRKLIEPKRAIYKSAIIVEDFNSLFVTDKTIRYKISKIK